MDFTTLLSKTAPAAMAPPKTAGLVMDSQQPSMADWIRSNWQGEWNAGGQDQAAVLASLMQANGITDPSQLSGLRLQTVKPTAQAQAKYNSAKANQLGNDGGIGFSQFSSATRGLDMGGQQLMLGDRALGFLGDYNLDGSISKTGTPYLQKNGLAGWTGMGDGNVAFYAVTDPKTGAVSLRPTWNSSSDAYIANDLAKIGAVLAGGYYGGNAMAEAGAGMGGADVAGTSFVGEGTGGSLINAGSSVLPEAVAAEAATAPAGLMTVADLPSVVSMPTIGAAAGGAAGGVAGSSLAGGAVAPAMNAVQADSAAGTPGYGASSAGAGNGLSLGQGGLGMSGGHTSLYDTLSGLGLPAGAVDAISNLGGNAMQWAIDNPKLARGLFTLAGGLMGATQGGAGGGGAAPKQYGPAKQWASGLQTGVQQQPDPLLMAVPASINPTGLSMGAGRFLRGG